MDCGLTWNEMWSLLGAACFLGMVIGAMLVALTQTGHSKNAFWEEE